MEYTQQEIELARAMHDEEQIVKQKIIKTVKLVRGACSRTVICERPESGRGCRRNEYGRKSLERAPARRKENLAARAELFKALGHPVRLLILRTSSG